MSEQIFIARTCGTTAKEWEYTVDLFAESPFKAGRIYHNGDVWSVQKVAGRIVRVRLTANQVGEGGKQ